MTLKSHAKCEEKLTFRLKNNMRNLANFHQNTWKCQNWDFDGTLKLYVMTLKNDEKLEEELTCRFKIDIRNLTNFDSTIRKSQKCAL